MVLTAKFIAASAIASANHASNQATKIPRAIEEFLFWFEVMESWSEGSPHSNK